MSIEIDHAGKNVVVTGVLASVEEYSVVDEGVNSSLENGLVM